MMDNLRKAANGVLFKIILTLIILSIIITGIGNYLIGSGSNYAAKVNGYEISRAQLNYAFNNERNRQYQILGGEQFSQLAGIEGYIQQMHQKVLSRLVDEVLLEQYASHLKLAISDNQIKQAIFNQPEFQTESKFDNAKYLKIIKNMGLSAKQYAEALRKQLATQQLITSIVGTDFALKGETDILAELIYQQRVVRYATLHINSLVADQQVVEEEIKNYYTKYKDNFLNPEQFRVRYLKLDTANIKLTISENDIQNWYDQHKYDFVQPQRKRYSIIQLHNEADAKDVLAQLKHGVDFSKLAKSRSIDSISMRNGGDIGWLDPITTPDEIKNANLTTKNQISGIVKSSIGFLIIRLDDIQSEHVIPLIEVHDDIADKVRQEKVLNAYYELQQRIRDAVSNSNESLVSAEQIVGIKTVETDWFSRNNIPKELNFKQVKDVIFNSNLNGLLSRNSDIITVDRECSFILRITGYKPEVIRSLDDVKAQIINILKYNKATQEAKIQAGKILAELKAGKQDALLEAGLKFDIVKTLTRNDQDTITKKVFSLPQPQPNQSIYSISEDIHGNIVLLKLEEVKIKNLSKTQKQILAHSITQNNAQIAFNALLNNLRKESKIKYNPMI